MRGNVRWQAGGVAQQRHHLHRLARTVDAAIQPDISIERPRVRQADDASIRQVECSGGQVKQRIVVAAQHLDRTRAGRSCPMQQRRGEAADAIRIGGGFAEDFVVLRQQPSVAAARGFASE